MHDRVFGCLFSPRVQYLLTPNLTGLPGNEPIIRHPVGAGHARRPGQAAIIIILTGKATMTTTRPALTDILRVDAWICGNYHHLVQKSYRDANEAHPYRKM